MSDGKVTLELTKQEAIVLMAFLLRFRDKDVFALEDQAETQILWDLCSLLEDQLQPELFDPRWGELVDSARKVVGDTSSW
jgi:hypothetical protein